MSAVISSSSKRLSVAIPAATLDNGSPKLLAIWIKWDGGQAHNSINCAMEMLGDGDRILQVSSNATPQIRARGSVSGVSPGSTGPSGSYSDDVWILGSAYMSAKSPSPVLRGYRNTDTAGSAGLASDEGAVTEYHTINIGSGSPFGSSAWLKGKVAEVSVWNVANPTEADTIVAELVTKKASAVTSASPAFYDALFDMSSPSPEWTVTNVGSVAFDDEDHPSLAGPEEPAVLTNPEGAATGPSTAVWSVDTDIGSGTIYALASLTGTENKAGVVAAGNAVLVSEPGTQSDWWTGLDDDTTYYPMFVHVTTGGESNLAIGDPFDTNAIDMVPPELTEGTAIIRSNALIVAGMSTDKPNGTIYVAATESDESPDAAQVRAGTDEDDQPASAFGSIGVASTGAKTLNLTGLGSLTDYYLHRVHQSASGVDSDVLTTGPHTTFPDGALGQHIMDTPGSFMHQCIDEGDEDTWFWWVEEDGPEEGEWIDGPHPDGTFIFEGPISETLTFGLWAGIEGVPTKVGTFTVSLYDVVLAPVLSSPAASATGETSAVATITTSQAGGVAYCLVLPVDVPPPSDPGEVVSAGIPQSVTTAGNLEFEVEGLGPGQSYRAYFAHRIGGLDSNLAQSSVFTTPQAPGPTAPLLKIWMGSSWHVVGGPTP